MGALNQALNKLASVRSVFFLPSFRGHNSFLKHSRSTVLSIDERTFATLGGNQNVNDHTLSSLQSALSCSPYVQSGLVRKSRKLWTNIPVQRGRRSSKIAIRKVICSQSAKNLRPTTPNFTRFLILGATETEAPIDNGLANQTPQRAIMTVLSVFAIVQGFFCGCAQASEAIKASSLGMKIASFLRQTGWPDEAIVFLISMLPVLELRGAIPVGYWMHMDPFKLSMLSVLGNMVPVPFIVLYMEKLSKFLSNRSSAAKKVINGLLESIRRKAAPVQEFEWLGLMLFVAVPFPGTGAWTGAMVASVLGMPFGQALSANFVGVVMAGLLVNLLVNLGLKYAVIVGVTLFVISTFMWSFLRAMGKSKH